MKIHRNPGRLYVLDITIEQQFAWQHLLVTRPGPGMRVPGISTSTHSARW
jgi:hypothetical protein